MTSRHIDYDEEKESRTAWVIKTGGPANGGLTVRDYFAAKAMEIMANFYTDNYDVAVHAYNLADAMMKEREK